MTCGSSLTDRLRSGKDSYQKYLRLLHWDLFEHFLPDLHMRFQGPDQAFTLEFLSYQNRLHVIAQPEDTGDAC